MKAVFSWVNAHGGVDGRKINFTYLDDGYNPANTATLTRKLVLQDNIFADVGSLGTPTQSAVQGFLNSQKVPQLFIESGCNCWSNPKYPYSLGWQPPYTVDGKILGAYIKANFAGKKIGYLSQDDEFGQDVVKGLDMEIPSSAVVSRQTYDAATLAGPLSNQMAALKAAGAQVVVLATIPAATALAMLPAAVIGYSPQYVVDSVGADAPTVGPLLASFTQKGGGTAAQAAAAGGLLNGVITTAYFAPESDTSNPWVQVEKKLLQQYAPSLYSKPGLDGNTQYGVALAYTFVQALQKAGKNLTRQSLLDAINSDGQELRDPGLRAAVVLELGALRVRRRGDREAGELGAARGHPDRQLDRRCPRGPGGGDQPRLGTGAHVHGADVGSAQEPGVDSLSGAPPVTGGGGLPPPPARRSRRALAHRRLQLQDPLRRAPLVDEHRSVPVVVTRREVERPTTSGNRHMRERRSALDRTSSR